MYLVRVVRVGRGDLRGVMNKLRAWYAFRKLYSVTSGNMDNASHYLVADEDSLKVLIKVLETNGYRVDKVERLESVPWYLEEISGRLLKHARQMSLKRKSLGLLRLMFRGGVSVKEFAEKSRIDYGKLLKTKKKLSKLVLVELLPRVSAGEELIEHAIRVGLIPIIGTKYYYSGSFNSKNTDHAEVLGRLRGTPHGDFRRKLREALADIYSVDTKRTLKSLYSSKAFQEALAESKVVELRNTLDLDYRICRCFQGSLRH